MVGYEDGGRGGWNREGRKEGKREKGRMTEEEKKRNRGEEEEKKKKKSKEKR